MFGLGKAKPPTAIVVNCVNGCPRDKRCPKWVIFTQTKIVEGKETQVQTGNCADVWTSILLIELKEAIVKREQSKIIVPV